MKAKFWKPDFNHARDLTQNLPALPTAVALDSEGKLAFIADAQGIIRVFQTADGKAVGEIQANPPTIETRLQTLAAGIANQEQRLIAAEKTISETKSARDSARQQLSELEKSLQQAVEIQKAAQAGAEQSPGEVTAKIAAEAAARIPAAEQAISTQRSALEAAEKAAADATTAFDSSKLPLIGLQSALKRWSAAAINTKALATRRQAEESALQVDDSQLNFTKSAAVIATQAGLLNSKRSERDRLANRFKAPQSREIAAELQATLAAIDIRITAEQETLTKVETETLTLRDLIEQSSPLALQKRSESQSFQTDYLKALE